MLTEETSESRKLHNYPDGAGTTQYGGANEGEERRPCAAARSKTYAVCARRQRGFPVFISSLAFIEPVGRRRGESERDLAEPFV